MFRRSWCLRQNFYLARAALNVLDATYIFTRPLYTRSIFLRGNPIHIRMHMSQEQPVSSLREHCHASVDITPITLFLVQWGRCCRKVGITRYRAPSSTLNENSFLDFWPEANVPAKYSMWVTWAALGAFLYRSEIGSNGAKVNIFYSCSHWLASDKWCAYRKFTLTCQFLDLLKLGI